MKTETSFSHPSHQTQQPTSIWRALLCQSRFRHWRRRSGALHSGHFLWNGCLPLLKSLALLLAVHALVACGKRTRAVPGSSSHGHGHGHEEGAVNFERGKGVILPAETLSSLGVTAEEVAERELRPVVTITAQVYRGAEEPTSVTGRYRTGHAYASAAVSPATLGKEGIHSILEVRVRRAGPDTAEREARVIAVDESLVQASRTIEVLLEIPDETRSLAVTGFVTAIIRLKAAGMVTAIPRSALLRAAEGNFVYVRNGKHLLRTEVQTGAADGDWIEVKDGLLPGDLFAAQGVEALWLTELRAVKGGGHCH